MITLQDVNNIEGEAESAEEYYCSIQRAINSGTAWSLQGSYGRTMMDAIESGHCMTGVDDARDYWGNVVPSRTRVREGTKGSRSFVAARHNEDWAIMLENVK